VKNRKHTSQARYRWLIKPVLSHAYRPWLINNQSLTAKLQQRYSDFYVVPLTVSFLKPMRDEVTPLRLSADSAVLMRDVLLFGGQNPVVFAHSILSRKSLRGVWHGLGKLGNKPLGATLFANPRVKRTALSYKKLSPNHVLYQHAIKHLVNKPACLWARRSVFSLNCATIMVTEVFLPNIITP
jgi:chorismate--pyruvate lyase